MYNEEECSVAYEEECSVAYEEEASLFRVSLLAALGKRTKFQEKNLPQMKLDVVLNEERGKICFTMNFADYMFFT